MSPTNGPPPQPAQHRYAMCLNIKLNTGETAHLMSEKIKTNEYDELKDNKSSYFQPSLFFYQM